MVLTRCGLLPCAMIRLLPRARFCGAAVSLLPDAELHHAPSGCHNTLHDSGLRFRIPNSNVLFFHDTLEGMGFSFILSQAAQRKQGGELQQQRGLIDAGQRAPDCLVDLEQDGGHEQAH